MYMVITDTIMLASTFIGGISSIFDDIFMHVLNSYVIIESTSV